MEKMTKKEMFTYIATVLADNADVVDFCSNEIELLNKKAEKARIAAAAKKAAGDELTDAVKACLTDEAQTIAEIASKIEGPDVTVAKCTYRLTQLVKNGDAEKIEVTLPATDGGKSRKVMAYKLA